MAGGGGTGGGGTGGGGASGGSGGNVGGGGTDGGGGALGGKPGAEVVEERQVEVAGAEVAEAMAEAVVALEGRRWWAW